MINPKTVAIPTRRITSGENWIIVGLLNRGKSDGA
jgi:hypothetical protein